MHVCNQFEEYILHLAAVFFCSAKGHGPQVWIFPFAADWLYLTSQLSYSSSSATVSYGVEGAIIIIVMEGSIAWYTSVVKIGGFPGTDLSPHLFLESYSQLRCSKQLHYGNFNLTTAVGSKVREHTK